MMNRCAHYRSRWLPVWAAACALVVCGGCQSLSRRGPVSKEVLNCRQLSTQGMAAMDHGEWQKAEDLLKSAVGSCPVDPEARQRYAEALWHRGDAAAAMGQLEEAARLSPDSTAVPIRMGEIYLALDRWENARRAADTALAIDRTSGAGWRLRGQASQAGGDLRQALADYQRALGCQPNDAVALEQMAELYRLMGQPERALTALQTLIDTYPPGEEPPRALHLEGLALVALGRQDAAIESFRHAIARGGGSPDLLCSLGEAELACGRVDSAQNTVQKALAIAPQHPASRLLSNRIQVALAPGDMPLRR